uniref:Uncharacterized protein n=1 Tax=Opuntia streptacantha TaxID=393608 RepID=A0A7C8ZZX0_OPUST
MIASISSTRSTYTSLLARLFSVVLHGTYDAVAPGRLPLTLELLPVTALSTLLTMLGGAIISFRMLDSVVKGKPLSIISSRSSYTITKLSFIRSSFKPPR